MLTYFVEVYLNLHGKVTLSWDKDLLIIEAFGPFNDEGLDYYNALIKNAINGRSCESWKRLEIWDNEVLGSPSVVDKCKAMHGWYDENRCVLSAVVVSNRIQEIILREKVNTSAHIFFSSEDARNWLNVSRNLDKHY